MTKSSTVQCSEGSLKTDCGYSVEAELKGKILEANGVVYYWNISWELK